MKSVQKHLLSIVDDQAVRMRKDAEILSVGLEYGVPYLYAIEDMEKEKEDVMLFMCSTERTQDSIDHKYVGTFKLPSDLKACHLFLKKEEVDGSKEQVGDSPKFTM